MKIYLAGKITGDKDYYDKFGVYKMWQEWHDHTVLSPADLPEDMAPADYMRICFAMLETADAAAFLPDWESSAGARLERAWCEYTGKRIVDLAPVDGLGAIKEG